jgi:hypothetical protein
LSHGFQTARHGLPNTPRQSSHLSIYVEHVDRPVAWL